MDIETLKLPGPEQVGKANTYLLRGEENTLVDTGLRKKETMLALKSELSDLGLKIEDIDRVLITHEHSDHFGNASKIREASDATVAMHKKGVPIVEDYGHYIEKQSHRAEKYFVKNGVPEEENKNLYRKAIPEIGEVSVEIDERLEDGDLIQVGEASLKVIHTPGHTPGSTTFVDENNSFGFVGDTVLSGITPNPMLYLRKDDIYPSLRNYLNSLKKLRELELEKLYTGHGETIEEPGKRIDEILNHHDERKQNTLEIVEEKRTVFEFMKRMFPDLEREKYLFGFSEAVAHLELLVCEEKVERVEKEKTFYKSC
jgi:glyoxylase-like metal-dependent hydrolase (beta-lactamase superfamily II)